jgi:FKBP-type peptidyl-prolyl cis-trans isomerase (trigger factor)
MIIREEARERDKDEARRITARQEAHRRVDLDREMKKVEEQKKMAAETEALRRRMEELSYRYV